MGLIFEAGNHGREDIPKRLVPLIVFSTWLSHLFGASVGREGVAVQIGGVIGHAIGV
ncbi:chloride channel protein [Lactococcus lactis]